MSKSTALHALLSAEPNVERTVFIKRLGTEFTVKALSSDEIERAQAECTYSDGKGGKKVHDNKLGAALIAKACVDPAFTDRELIDRYGAEDAADCVRKALLAGEVAKLTAAIMDVSGFGDDDEGEIPN